MLLVFHRRQVNWTHSREKVLESTYFPKIKFDFWLIPLCQCSENESEVAQSCLTLRNPMDCSPPGSSVHGGLPTACQILTHKLQVWLRLICCCLVTQLCPTLCDPMDCIAPGFPVLYCLWGIALTHVHWVSDVIQPSHPVTPSSSCPQSFPVSRSFPMSQLLPSSGQSIGASALASVLPVTRLSSVSSVQSLSRVWLFATPWIAACQASLSITNSRSSLKLMSIESVMPSSHLILCRPLFLLPSIPSSIRVFSNESALRMRWPKYWSFSFSISPSSD